MKYILLLLSFILFTSSVYSQTAQDDLVTDFPGFGNYNYDIYSGLLNVTATGSRKIHYILVESQSDPLNDPLVIWLNGGPGCSSLLGLVQENGPFMFTGNNQFFTPNPESWNKKYNVLYLEGPPGVGFSPLHDPGYQWTEDNTGEDFLQAMVQFYKRFGSILNVNNDLWITGESYAGLYIPYFTKHILQYNKQNPANKMPIKGFLIGNGLFDSHEPFWNNFITQQYVDNHFFNREISSYWQSCLDHGILNLKCLKFNRVLDNVQNNTDLYQIYNYTYSYQDGDSSAGQFIQQKLESDDESPMTYSLKKLYESRKFNINDAATYVTPDDVIHHYFNLPEVKKALHVESVHREWNQCNRTILNTYHRGTSTELYASFFEAGLRLMIYSGNTDSVVPHQYSTYFIEEIKHNPKYNSTLTPNGKWRQWYPEGSQQVGGMVQYYKSQTGSEFVYTMIRAAGHEVPTYQPLAAWHMFDNFVQNKPL